MHRHDPALQMWQVWMRIAVGSGSVQESLSQFFFLVFLVVFPFVFGGSSFLSFCSFFSVSSFLVALPFLMLRRVRSGCFSFFFFASFSFYDRPFLV